MQGKAIYITGACITLNIFSEVKDTLGKATMLSSGFLVRYEDGREFRDTSDEPRYL
jgi:hypothetical protein